MTQIKRVEFWALFGPFVVLFALVLVLYKASPKLFVFPVAALCAYPICIKWKVKGLIASIVGLFALGAFYYLPLPHEEMSWMITFSLMVAVSLAVITFSTQEFSNLLKGWQSESFTLKKEHQRIQEKIKELHAEWEIERTNLCEELFLKNQEMAKLRSALRKQAPVVEESLPRDVKEITDLYKQLRVQFDQKGETLHQARAQIFEMEGLLFAAQKEKELEDGRQFEHLQSLLDYTLQEKEILEAEVADLHTIVTSLSIRN